MNDSLRTDIFLRFTSETIACACIDLAARNLKVTCALWNGIHRLSLSLQMNRSPCLKRCRGTPSSVREPTKFVTSSLPSFDCTIIDR